MSVNISLFAGAGAQFFDNNGVPLTGGLLYTYSAGTTTPSATYTSITGSIANSNPIVLDSSGRVPNEIWLTSGSTYKFILQNSSGVQIGSWDNIPGINDFTSLYTQLASSNGSSLIGYKQGNTSSVLNTVQAKLQQTIYVDDFIPQGTNTQTTDCSGYINSAIQSLSSYASGSGSQTYQPCVVQLGDNKIYLIKSSIILTRGISLIANGTSQIIADFSNLTNWVAVSNGTSGVNVYVAIQCVISQSISTSQQFQSWGSRIGGFQLIGKNNSSVLTYGMQIFNSFGTIPVSSATNFSWKSGTFFNIVFSQFDTALNILEAWQCDFCNLQVNNCRSAINIAGKSVDCFFYGTMISNPDNSNGFTPSTLKSLGISINSGFQYQSATEGRPEGIFFYGGMVYGNYNNIALLRADNAVISGMDVDGAINHSITILDPAAYTIENCYIYTSGGSGIAAIYFQGISTTTTVYGNILNNYLVGAGTSWGIAFADVGVSYSGIVIANNQGTNFSYMLYLQLCPINSQIINNYAELLNAPMIYIQDGGNRSIVDGNTFYDGNAVLLCQPSTSSSLIIGKNVSATNSTYYVGEVILTAGNTSVSLPNNFFGSGAFTGDNYVRPVTFVTFTGASPGNWYITELTSNSNATFNVATALSSNVKIRYQVIAVPYTAY